MKPESKNIWLPYIDMDLRQIENNLRGPMPSPEGAAYHIQQAAEKILKSVLSDSGINPPKSHNLSTLVAMLPKQHPLWTELEKLERFTVYAIAYRYPSVGLLEAAPETPSIAEIDAWLMELKSLLGKL